MILVLVVLVAVTALVGAAVLLAVRRLPRLAQQVTSLALFALVLPLASVTLSGAVMLHAHDAFEVLLLAVVSAVVAGVGALVIARGITRPLRVVHDAATQIAAGDLGTRIDVTGPAELAELGEAFNTMAASVQQVFDARRDFIAWASHDLRTPVASLQAMVEAIEDGVTPPERYLPAIGERIGDLARLVEDLFDFARTELEPRSPSDVLADAVEVAGRAVATHQPHAAAQGVTIALHADLPAVPVRCPSTDLVRVLDNLLANALHHTPPDGRVDVTVNRHGTISVTDSGPGFPPDSLERVFEPFWRGDLSRHSQGAGLGLAIARGLVERSGGTITASNAPGARLVVALLTGNEEPLHRTPDRTSSR
jgi:signal transduction histidine kinase